MANGGARPGPVTLIELLAARHSKDVFVSECKNGPTQSVRRGELRILDAWAMTRSWSNPASFGYEIKVSRGDFLRDSKWTSYLTLCNHFFWVCPHGLIAPEEVSPECGLLWASKNGRRLTTKKMAPRREIPPPEDLYRYVLMCRTRVVGTWGETLGGESLDFWRAWLAEKAEAQEVGHAASRRIRERVRDLKSERDRARRLVESYESIRSRLEEIGVDPEKPCSSWSLRVTHKEPTVEALARIKRSLQRALDDFEGIGD